MMNNSISTRPYFIRALYEWCLDSGYTPYIAVWVNEHTRVPAQFVKDNEIVLSISNLATKDLVIDNEWVHFHARFAGVSHEIMIPIGHVISIFAKENGEGMGFEIEPWEPEKSIVENQSRIDEKQTTAPQKKGLKLVK